MNCGKYCSCTQGGKCDKCETCLLYGTTKKELRRHKRELKKQEQKYNELYRITESYIKRLHISEDENKELRKSLDAIRCSCQGRAVGIADRALAKELTK